MDIEGDKQRHVRTLASRSGKKTALRVSGTLFTMFIGVSIIPCIANWLGTSYLILIVPTDLTLFYFTFRLLRSKTINEGQIRIRQLYLTLVLFIIIFMISRIIR